MASGLTLGSRTQRARYVIAYFMFSSHFKEHRGQWVNGALIVAGGSNDVSNDVSSETCTMNTIGKFKCVDISPSLTDHRYGVAFTVQTNYCRV